MNDGGNESGRDNQMSSRKSLPEQQQQKQEDQQQQQQQHRSNSSEFGRAAIKIAVAQICESSGFCSVQLSVLDALTDMARRYITDLGKNAKFYANLAGRSSCNVFDIIQALEDLSSSQGFLGATDAQHCLANSGVVKEMIQFVSSEEEVPFSQSIPRFPVARMIKPVPSFVQVGEAPPGKHIPDWLPKFPDPHTYIRTTVWNERDVDPKADKVERARQRRKAESSLLSLQQRLAQGISAWSRPVVDNVQEKGKQVVGANAFLAPPFSYGDKEVSQILPPDESPVEKRLSILETFAPVIESARVESLDDSNTEKKILPGNRQKIHFKIGIDKKSIATSLRCDALSEKKDLWSLRNDEKDDRKRRAELILREAMEKPHDLPQL